MKNTEQGFTDELETKKKVSKGRQQKEFTRTVINNEFALINALHNIPDERKEAEILREQTGFTVRFSEREHKIAICLGQGKFGKARIAQRIDPNHPQNISYVAVKKIKNDTVAIENSKEEVRLQQIASRNNPYVLPLIDAVETENSRGEPAFYIFMKLAGYGDGKHLIRYLGKTENLLREKIILRIAKDLLQGFDALHDQKISHLDFKPDNFLMDIEGHVYIADFGCAKQSGSLIEWQAQGYAYYRSPERIQAINNKGSFSGPAADIWALGLTLLELYTGKILIEEDQWQAFLQTPTQDNYNATIRHIALENPPENSLLCLIKGLLAYPVADRLSAKNALAMPIFQDPDFTLTDESFKNILHQIKNPLPSAAPAVLNSTTYEDSSNYQPQQKPIPITEQPDKKEEKIKKGKEEEEEYEEDEDSSQMTDEHEKFEVDEEIISGKFTAVIQYLQRIETKIDIPQLIAPLRQIEESQKEHSKILAEIKQEISESRVKKPIRNKTRNQLPIPILKSEELQTLNEIYQENLAKTYRAHRYIRTLFGGALEIENSYINLTVIKEHSTDKSTFDKKIVNENLSFSEANKHRDMFKPANANEHIEKNRIYEDKRTTSYEDLFCQKESIPLKDLFNQASTNKISQPHRFALVQGRAGIGKTVFSHYLSYLWSKTENKNEKNWLQLRYDYIFTITLRNLTTLNNDDINTIADLVFYTCFPEQNYLNFLAFWQQYLTTKILPERILFILDGYDEISTIITDENNTFAPIFKRLFEDTGFSVILTSRPYSFGDLPTHRQNLEIIGFSDENIEEYIIRYFQDSEQSSEKRSQKISRFIDFLKSNTSIWGSCHIPLILNIICSIREDLAAADIELSMSDLYIKLENALLMRAYDKVSKKTNKITEEKKLQNAQQHYQLERLFLQRLAFEAITKESLIISSETINKILDQCINADQNRADNNQGITSNILLLNAQQVGIIKPGLESTKAQTISELEKPHEFIHLTFQEYFAARFLAEALQDNHSNFIEAKQFILREKFNPRYQIIFWFVAGILKEQPKILQTYFGLIQHEATHDLLSDYQMGLLARCYEESISSENRDILRPVLKILENYLIQHHHWEPQKISNHLFIQSYFFDLMKLNPKLNKDLLALVLSIHKSRLFDEPPIANDLLLFICYTGIASMEIVPDIIRLLSHRNDIINNNVIASLVVLAQKNPNPIPVLDALIQITKNPYIKTRHKAAAALGSLKEKAATPEVINALIENLKDKNLLVGLESAFALGKIGRKKATKEIIDALINILLNNNLTFSQRGPDFLDQLSKDDREKYMFQQIDESQSITEGVNLSEIVILVLFLPLPLEKLLPLKNTQQSYAHYLAAKALGFLGQKIEICRAKSILITKLKEKNEPLYFDFLNSLIYMGIVEALSHMKNTDAEIININIKNLRIINDSVRSFASTYLITLGKNNIAMTPFIIDQLKKSLWQFWFSNLNYSSDDETISTLCELIKIKPDDENVRFLIAILTKGKTAWRGLLDFSFALLIPPVFYNSHKQLQIVAKTLGKLGQVILYSEIKNALVKTLNNDNKYLRYSVACALVEIEKDTIAADIQKILITGFLENSDKDYDIPDKEINNSFIKCFIKEECQPIRKFLFEILENENSNNRYKAISILGQLGVIKSEIADQFLPDLLKALKDQNEKVSCAAAKALGNFGENATDVKAILTALCDILATKNHPARSDAIGSIGKLGRRALTLDILHAVTLALLDDDNIVVIQNAGIAITKLGEQALDLLMTKHFSGQNPLLLESFFTLAAILLKERTSLQLDFDGEQFRAITYAYKKKQIFPIARSVAQILYYFPLSAMLQGYASFDFDLFENLLKKLPPSDQDEFLIKLKNFHIEQKDIRVRGGDHTAHNSLDVSQARLDVSTNALTQTSRQGAFNSPLHEATQQHSVEFDYHSWAQEVLSHGQFIITQLNERVAIEFEANDQSSPIVFLQKLDEYIKKFANQEKINIVKSWFVHDDYLFLETPNEVVACQLVEFLETRFRSADSHAHNDGAVRLYN